jgi:hypothetical protein
MYRILECFWQCIPCDLIETIIQVVCRGHRRSPVTPTMAQSNVMACIPFAGNQLAILRAVLGADIENSRWQRLFDKVWASGMVSNAIIKPLATRTQVDILWNQTASNFRKLAMNQSEMYHY